MNKEDLKKMLSAAGIKQWQVADRLGLREETLSRKLRHELDSKDEALIVNAISSIVKEKEKKTDAEN